MSKHGYTWGIMDKMSHTLPCLFRGEVVGRGRGLGGR